MDDLASEPEPPEDLHDDSGSANDSSATGSQLLHVQVASPVWKKLTSRSGFHRSTKICLEQIREALLHHRWQEAAELMACYAQKLECTNMVTTHAFKELVWRISTEILHHHPDSAIDHYNIIYERLKDLGVRHYLKVSLEHSFHLMLHGHIEAAKHQLSVAESWRYGKESATHLQTSRLIQAYRSLLDYISWCDKRVTHSNSDNPDSKYMHSCFRQASVNLKEILRNPGVWDTFILCYTEMLEFYGDHKKVLKVLKRYAYDDTFPPNPNAHVYLYQYIKRQDASKKNQMQVLEKLHALVPSHELMLEYSALLLQSGGEHDLQRALAVVLAMLDFACWRTNLDVWRCLQAIVDKLQLEKNWEDIISESMAGRKDWWPALHFTAFHARKDSEENRELMEVKASLTKTLCPDLNLTYAAGQVSRATQT